MRRAARCEPDEDVGSGAGVQTITVSATRSWEDRNTYAASCLGVTIACVEAISHDSLGPRKVSLCIWMVLGFVSDVLDIGQRQ